jgi:hypothetical protein
MRGLFEAGVTITLTSCFEDADVTLDGTAVLCGTEDSVDMGSDITVVDPLDTIVSTGTHAETTEETEELVETVTG